MEGVINHYKTLILETEKPGIVLTKFYCELFEKEFSITLVKQFNRLIKLYGREPVFRALIDISFSETLKHDNIFGLLNFICKKYLNGSEDNIETNLTSFVEEADYKISRARINRPQIRSFLND